MSYSEHCLNQASGYEHVTEAVGTAVAAVGNYYCISNMTSVSSILLAMHQLPIYGG